MAAALGCQFDVLSRRCHHLRLLDVAQVRDSWHQDAFIERMPADARKLIVRTYSSAYEAERADPSSGASSAVSCRLSLGSQAWSGRSRLIHKRPYPAGIGSMRSIHE